MNDSILTVDVREDLRRGREPFSRIMRSISQLGGDALRLVAPFEPVPLYRVLDGLGFDHETRQIGPGEWQVLFKRRDVAAPREAASKPCGCGCGCADAEVLEVDARGLEPPEPMVRILEALAGLPVGGELLACTDRRPLHLYPQLEARGFRGITEEQSDGTFITRIRPT